MEGWTYSQQLSRRRFLKCVSAFGGIALHGAIFGYRGLAFGSPCPQIAGRKVRWIVPYSPGGGYDVYSRLIAPFLAGKIGAQIVVENISGSGGALGADAVKQAPPDGLTLGLVDIPGLMIASLIGSQSTPNPAEDFIILGRVVRSRHVWCTGKGSCITSIEDVFKSNTSRPIILGAGEITQTTFVDLAVASHLLNINAEFVVGYHGTRNSSMAVIRGDVDIVAATFESVLDRIESGDLVPLLQISSERISGHPALQGVPLLGGSGGLAARRAAGAGRGSAEAVSDAAALIGLVGAGRLVVAPLGIDYKLVQCLEEGLYAALTDPSFEQAASKAKRSLDVATGSVALGDIMAVQRKAEKLTAIYTKAVEKARR